MIARQWTPRQVLWRLGLAVLPAALWLGWDLYRGDPRLVSPKPPYEIVYSRPLGDVLSRPTVGMRLSAEGFGTVVEAPGVLAAMNDTVTPPRRGEVASDVARFMRVFPQLRARPGVADQPMLCTLEVPPTYRARAVLKDGCLILRSPATAPSDIGLMLGDGLSVFRDDNGYLAIGRRDGPDEFRLRVGEAGGLLQRGGCGNGLHKAELEYAKSCGVDQLTMIVDARRRPVCSARHLAERKRQEEEHMIIAKRQARIAAACRASGQRMCPPEGIPGPPPYDLNRGC